MAYRALSAVALAVLAAGVWYQWPQYEPEEEVPLEPHVEPYVKQFVKPINDLPGNFPLEDGQEFEYIVVGGGAGGSAAAARLALSGARVLLVEAGENPNLLSAIPGAAMALLGSKMDWKYETESNKMSCLSSEREQCRFSRGLSLGGSTSINYMMYTRGSPQDYDTDIPGWTWKDFRPYFLRYEGFQDLNLLPESSVPYHNTSGVEKTQFFSDSGISWHERVFNGLKSLNFPSNPDVSAESQIGVTQVIGYVYKGKRMSTARAYLTLKDVKANLKVAKNARCTGVIIDDDNDARGITVVQGDSLETLRVYAQREVVLSAGAIGTPQILMLSGVGPAEHLKEMGIKVRADLPVGDNLSDHVLPLMPVMVNEDAKFVSGFMSIVQRLEKFALPAGARIGSITSNGLTDVTGFANVDCYDFDKRQLVNDRPECKLPTLQLIHAFVDKGLIGKSKALFKRTTNFKEHIIEQMAEANEKRALITLSPVLLTPWSRGQVRLGSLDPLAPPKIIPNFLSDERDVDVLMKIVRIVKDLMLTPEYKSGDAELLKFKLPGCPDISVDEDAYWRCYVRHMTFAVYHSCGTASLGAVVDERLRVRTVRRLRVADLSVQQVVPRGNTAAAAIAYGERVSDFILEDKLPPQSPPSA